MRKTFQWTFWGSALGGIWMMVLGSYIAADVGVDKFETIGSLKSTADKLFPDFGDIILVVFAVGLSSVIALNMYGGSLTLISSLDSVIRVRPTVWVRIATVGLTAALSLLGAFTASKHFLDDFSNFLLLVLYFFIPWTAVNLTDYFVVRRGHYAIAEIFKPNGIYGRWGWPGIVSYLVGFGCMVPFFNANSLFEGFLAKDMQGADISMFIGLPIAAVLYWALTRNIDVAAEARLANQQARDLEIHGAG